MKNEIQVTDLPKSDAETIAAVIEVLKLTGASLYADAGYDADWVHRFCHQPWGTESIIKRPGAAATAVWAVPTARP